MEELLSHGKSPIMLDDSTTVSRKLERLLVLDMLERGVVCDHEMHIEINIL